MKGIIISFILLSALNIFLVAQTTPNITFQPVSQTLTEGQTASFTVQASCDGPMGFQWWAGGSNQWNNGDKGGRLSIVNTSNSSTLTITNVNIAQDNNNIFVCEVKNLNGYPTAGYWVNTQVAILTVFAENAQWNIQTLNSGTSKYFNTIAHFDIANIVAVGQAGSLVRSTDGGANWSTITGVPAVNFSGANCRTSGMGWIVGDNGTIMKTTNFGSTWNSQTSGTNNVILSVYSFDDQNIIATAAGGTVLKTTNGGTLWTIQTIPSSGMLRSVNFLDSQIGYIAGGNFSDQGTAGGFIFRTSDGGITWTKVFSGSNIITTIQSVSNTTAICVGVNASLYRSTNGGLNWSSLNAGTPHWLYALHFFSESEGFIIGGGASEGIVNFTKNLTQWSRIYAASSQWLNACTFPNNSTGYIAGYNGKIYKLIKSVNYFQLLTPNGGENYEVGSVHNITWTYNNSTTNVKIEYSTNNGNDWLSIINSTPANNGFYAWTLPSTSSTNCIVKISDAANSSVYDVSDNIFTIYSLEATVSWLDTIKVSDNGIDKGILIYGQAAFATDSIDFALGELTLPPVPPAGVFDIRFELPLNTPDFSLRDFRDDILQTRNWLIKFQPGNGDYPVTFTWNPSALPMGLFYLRDIVTGTIVNVDMKQNSSYTLTNTGITTLKIEYSTVPITWDATIQLKDNGNINKDLKFGQSPMGTEGIDNALGELPLPPAPPAGSFDARFEIPVVPTEYSYLDYRSDTSKAITWLMKFQPGSSGYPFTFTWDPLVLPEGFFFLKDNVTGTVVNVNMKLINTYTLTNTGITSLKIEYARQVCLDVNLSQGWNIISVPVAALDMNTQTLFPDFTSPTYSYSNGYQTAATLENGVGYWIRYSAAKTENICGTMAGGSTIPIKTGWNIVGVYGEDIPVASITTTPASILTSPFYGFNNGYVQPTDLQVGKGYWIRSSQNGVINLSTLAKPNQNQSVSNPIDPKWGRVIITDSEGKSGVVYLAKGDNDLQKFDLPPVPPKGIFDVRYSNDRNVELASAVNEILINSSSYPIQVRVEGTDVRIKDSFTGRIVDKVLRNGESIIIEDNALNKFTVGEADIPSEFALYQNYPNPFNPSTTIKFGLPDNSNVSLIIYNQLGEKIAVLIDRNMEAGFHAVNWNAVDLASGLYFYELRAGKFSSVKKLLLMK